MLKQTVHLSYYIDSDSTTHSFTLLTRWKTSTSTSLLNTVVMEAGVMYLHLNWNKGIKSIRANIFNMLKQTLSNVMWNI